MTERELFEEWAYSNKWNIFRYPKSDYHSKEGQYCDEFVEWAWHGWQASASRQEYKLVPVEPTEEMIDAGVDESDVDWKRLKFAYQAMIGAIE